jgi:histone chaperone ASF1
VCLRPALAAAAVLAAHPLARNASSDVTVLNNPAKFTDPYLFKITFECMAPLQDGAHPLACCSRPPLRPQVLILSGALACADLEWKLTYVGSAESDSFDQELDTCMVGPVPVGVNSFEFEVGSRPLHGPRLWPLHSHPVSARRSSKCGAPENAEILTADSLSQAAAPLPTRIPASDLIGVTVILLTCSYNDAEFVRIGYYVNTEYSDPELKRQHDASLEEGAEEKGLKAPNPLEHIEAMQRNVLADKPRVTKFNIQWCVRPLLLACPFVLPAPLSRLVLPFRRDTPAAVPTISSTDVVSAPASQALAADSGASSAPPPPFNPYAAAA